MLRIVWILVALFPSSSSAEPIWLEHTKIEIPNPRESHLTYSSMDSLHAVTKAFVAPTHIELLTFLPAAGFSTAVLGDLPPGSRWYSLQALKRPPQEELHTFETFAEFKGRIRSSIRGSRVSPKRRLDFESEAGDIFSSLQGRGDHLVLRLIGQTLLPEYFSELDRFISYGGYFRHLVFEGGQRTDEVRNAAAFSIVLVRGKLVTLSVHANVADLEWAKREVDTWAEAVIEANPAEAPAFDRFKEKVARAVERLDWVKAVRQVLFGGLVGGAITLYGLSRSRRRASQAAPPSSGST